MSWLSSSPSSAIGLGMDLWPILANEIERDVCWGSRKIFSLIGVWYMRRKALFPLSPSFLLVTLSCEIINWTRDHYLAPMKGDIASTSKGGRRKGKQSLGPSCTAEPTPESPPFRLPVRVDNQISFLFKPLLVLKSATCNHTHAMLKTKQTKVTVSSYVPNYLKPRSSFLLGIIPRYTTDISDSTGPKPNSSSCFANLHSASSLGCTAIHLGTQARFLGVTLVRLVPHLPYPISQQVTLIWPFSQTSPIPSSLFYLGPEVHHLSPGPLPPTGFPCLWSCISRNLSPPASSRAHSKGGSDLVIPLSEIH